MTTLEDDVLYEGDEWQLEFSVKNTLTKAPGVGLTITLAIYSPAALDEPEPTPTATIGASEVEGKPGTYRSEEVEVPEAGKWVAVIRVPAPFKSSLPVSEVVREVLPKG